MRGAVSPLPQSHSRIYTRLRYTQISATLHKPLDPTFPQFPTKTDSAAEKLDTFVVTMELAAEARFLWAVMLAAAAAVPAARGVWLNMPSSGQKCVFEELQSNAVVMGDFYSFYGDGDVNYTVNPTLTVQVFLSFYFYFYFILIYFYANFKCLWLNFFD